MERPGLSQQNSKNFFDIGTDIPISGFLENIYIDGKTIINTGESEGEKAIVVTVDSGNIGVLENTEELPRYMIYLMGGIVFLLILIFVVWYVARKRMMLRVRAKIQKLRIDARPENLITSEIRAKIRQVRHKANKDKQQEPDNCAICCDDFKEKEKISMTDCNHLFHDTCLWKWIETKIKQTVAEIERQALEGQDLNQMHPAQDCV